MPEVGVVCEEKVEKVEKMSSGLGFVSRVRKACRSVTIVKV